MPSPPIARIIALLVAFSFLLTTKAPAQKPAKPQPDYSQEAVVLERITNTHRLERDGTGQHEAGARVKVQNAAGVERFGQLVFSYNSANEKLDMNFVRVLKADGTVVNATPSDVQDLTAPVTREAPVYTDVRQKHITVRSLRPGDVLEYQMIWKTHTALAPNHFWVEHNFVTSGPIVLNNELTIDIPAASKVKVKTHADFDAPAVKEDNDRRVYVWKHANLKPEDEKKKDEAAEKEEETTEAAPHVQLSTFQSWDEVGQWYADLQRDRIAPDDKVKAKAEALISGRTTDKEKVEALYDYVSRNFRYVSLSLGQGRYQSHPAASVMNNQYGDCKDKHTLLAAMLAAVGLRASPVLIGFNRELDVDVPSPAQFNHVISAIPLGNETLWVDTTAEIAPLALLQPHLRNKKALLIPTTGPARVETTPAKPPYLFSELIDLEATVDDLGKLKARARMVLRSDTEMYLRFAFRHTARSDWSRIAPYLGVEVGIEGDVTDIKTSDPADPGKPFEIEFNVSAPYLDWASKSQKIELPFPPFSLSQLHKRKPDSTKPLELGPPIDIVYNLKLTLPAKYQARAPLPLKVSRDYAEYASNYKLQGQTLTGDRTLRVRQHELPAERVQDYQAFVTAVGSDSAQTLSLESTVAGTPTVPDSVKTEDLIELARNASGNGDFSTAEVMLTRVIEKDPKNKTVRNTLGYVLAEQGKLDAALQVLREQIKINPFDDFAHSMIGVVYWGQGDYAGAEQSFRKQIEVTPLNQLAFFRLGLLLVEWGKYKEAIPELERALSLSSDEDKTLQLNLGRAYLHLDQTEKAMAAFEAALRIERSPAVLNDVAYHLSEKLVHLDKAVQYAESAVTTTANYLRNVELASLRLDDLLEVEALAVYWDTLGWVYFQQDDIDKAEQYIRASWMLQQDGDVAYNLGQIAEKRGKIDEAIRYYAQGTAALDTDSDAADSLDRLARKSAIPALLRTAKQDLRAYNVYNVGHLVPNLRSPIEAEFFLVYAPDATRNAQAIEVKFIKGDERLRPLAAQLKTIKYQLVFPGNSPTRIIRRGALLCLPKPAVCTFTMISPELVRSVD